eukprot:EG_transcript_2171
MDQGKSEEKASLGFLLELLEQGRRDPHLLSCEVHPINVKGVTLNVHNAHLPNKMRMLWQTDIDFCAAEKEYSEIIRVWYIGPASKVGDALSKMTTAFELSRRQLQRLHSLLPPALPPCDIGGHKIYYPRRVELKQVTPTDTLLMSKFHTVSQRLLTWLRSGESTSQREFPYRVDAMEDEVITADGNVLLLGRSGTGKTLCCIYRVCLQETRSLPDVPVRQVFLTKSQPLCTFAQSYFLRIATTEFELDEHNPGVPRSCPPPLQLNDLAPCHFPLFLPFRQFLLLLDGACRAPFFDRDAQGLPTTPAGRRFFVAEGRLLDEAMAEFQARRAKDPRNLQEVTFEVFASSLWPRLLSRLRLADVEAADWLEAHASPLLLWTEFTTYIKGSFASLDDPEVAHIAQSAYYGLGSKQAIALQDRREAVWQLYELYEKAKRSMNGFDLPDVVHHVYHELQRRPLRRSFDFLYLDEVQDLTQAEARLFFAVCSNRRSGFFMAGDTSQTVARGIDFRFCDLFSSFRFERLQQRPLPAGPLGTGTGQPATDALASDDEDDQDQAASSTVLGGHRYPLAEPKQMHLVHNRRSHAGIIALGNTCIHLIEQLFPYSIDKLDKDMGMEVGPYAMAFVDADLGVFLQQLPGPVGVDSAHHQAVPQFGHRQAFLVRTAAAKEAVQAALLEQQAQVYTVEEAKGLEFEVVFLVNFFGDSPFSDWSGLAKLSVAQDTPDWLPQCLDFNAAFSIPSALPPLAAADAHTQRLARRLQEVSSSRRSLVTEFDMRKNYPLCTELKQLYTAITRTKTSLVLFEADATKALPILHFWRRNGLVYLGLHECPEARRRLQGEMQASTEAEWLQRGEELMAVKQYGRAKQCFGYANEPQRRAAAQALETLQEAQSLERQGLPKSSSQALRMFAQAARELRALGLLEDAAAAYLGARQYGAAGDLLVQAGKWRE